MYVWSINICVHLHLFKCARAHTDPGPTIVPLCFHAPQKHINVFTIAQCARTHIYSFSIHLAQSIKNENLPRFSARVRFISNFKMLLFIYISSHSHIRKPEQVLARFFPLNCSAFDFVHTAFFALVIESTEEKKLTAQKEHLSIWILKNRDLHMKTQRFRKKAAAITSTMIKAKEPKNENGNILFKKKQRFNGVSALLTIM